MYIKFVHVCVCLTQRHRKRGSNWQDKPDLLFTLHSAAGVEAQTPSNNARGQRFSLCASNGGGGLDAAAHCQRLEAGERDRSVHCPPGTHIVPKDIWAWKRTDCFQNAVFYLKQRWETSMSNISAILQETNILHFEPVTCLILSQVTYQSCINFPCLGHHIWISYQ